MSNDYPKGEKHDFVAEVANKLRSFAFKHKVNSEWHEPDEQEVFCGVVGDHLDNAFGDHGGPDEHQEYVVLLNQDAVQRAGGDPVQQNLATLLAAATMGGGLRPQEFQLLRKVRDNGGQIDYDGIPYESMLQKLCWDLLDRGFLNRDNNERCYCITREGIQKLGEYA